MKIMHFYARNVRAHRELALDFRKPLFQQAHPFLLISGPNGTGKSYMLRQIRNLWVAATCCILDDKPEWENRDTEWIDKGYAMIIDSPLTDVENRVGIYLGSEDYLTELRSIHPDILWVGQIISKVNPTGENIAVPEEYYPFVQKWLHEYNRLILTHEQTFASNLIYLDAERRRWVEPTVNVGSLIPDDYRMRWLCTYEATENWQGQLEAGLVNLKIVDEENYQAIIGDMNKFLINKKIDPQIRRGDRNRLRVVLDHNPQQWHYLDDLSAGERQVLIMVYLISRWMEDGGIVLIDEPDLHLHPSLIQGFLHKIEILVSQRNGQLIITSHNPKVWDRYKTIGKRIRLGQPASSETVDEELEAAMADLDQWLEENDERLD